MITRYPKPALGHVASWRGQPTASGTFAATPHLRRLRLGYGAAAAPRSHRAGEVPGARRPWARAGTNVSRPGADRHKKLLSHTVRTACGIVVGTGTRLSRSARHNPDTPWAVTELAHTRPTSALLLAGRCRLTAASGPYGHYVSLGIPTKPINRGEYPLCALAGLTGSARRLAAVSGFQFPADARSVLPSDPRAMASREILERRSRRLGQVRAGASNAAPDCVHATARVERGLARPRGSLWNI